MDNATFGAAIGILMGILNSGGGTASDPITDITAMADMTDTNKLYRYNGSIYYYNGTEWTEAGSGDDAFFVVEVTNNWWSDPPIITANCT